MKMNLADHGVRKYDSALGRFLCPDAMWEKYISYTPYQYCRNNPINAIDFNGMDDGAFGSWMQVGPTQELILGDKKVDTYQEVVENSEKPENKQLIKTWAEIGMMGLSGIATEAVLSTKVATNVLSKAGSFLKGILGFGDDAAKGVTNLIPEGKAANHLFKGAGKLADNSENRALIQEISNGKALVVDKFGKSWYRGSDATGKGIYSYTQNGIVKGAGYTDLSPGEIIIKYGAK